MIFQALWMTSQSWSLGQSGLRLVTANKPFTASQSIKPQQECRGIIALPPPSRTGSRCLHGHTSPWSPARVYLVWVPFLVLGILACVFLRYLFLWPNRSYPQLEGRGLSVSSVSVCTESVKHQEENVSNINWPTTLILWCGQNTLCPPPPANFFIGGDAPFPFPMPMFNSVRVPWPASLRAMTSRIRHEPVEVVPRILSRTIKESSQNLPILCCLYHCGTPHSNNMSGYKYINK